MATDWVKMRTDIYRDHRVCMMAEILERKDGDLAKYVMQNKQRDMSVTRNVTRCATVGALVTLWGVTRHRGKRVGDDMLLPGCGLAVLDDIADLPGIGEAMEAVGWAKQIDEGVVLPAFFSEYNADPQETKRKDAAERQRRYREKKSQKSDVTRNVTRCATSHIEENRIEKNREESIKESVREVSVHSEDIRIPKNVDNEECRRLMDQLFGAMNQRRRESGEYNLDDFAIQANWDIAGQIGPDELATIVPKAIANNWKSLTVLGASGLAAGKVASKGRRRANEFTVDQEAEWVKITAACRMTGEKGDRARSALGPETCRIMTQIGGSQAIRDTKPGDYQETELKKRFFATRDADRSLKAEGVPA